MIGLGIDLPRAQKLIRPVWAGAGEENLIRDAAMDTDTDGDGVVDGWSAANSNGDWVASLNTSEGAQEFTAGGTGGDGTRIFTDHLVLRVFEGDVVTASIEARLADTPTDIQGEFQLLWLDSAGTNLGGSVLEKVNFTSTSYARHAHEGITAPTDAAIAVLRIVGRNTAANGSGDVRFRDARLLRASSDPATYANPHVNGGSQTGDTLDTAGWPGSTALIKYGDVLLIGGSGPTQANADGFFGLYRAEADVSSNASGEASIPVYPSLDSPPDGAALRFNPAR